MEYILLNNGVKCPVIGIGTFMLTPSNDKAGVKSKVHEWISGLGLS